MLHGTDGEQNQLYHRSQGHHHEPVRPCALQPKQVREAHRSYPPKDQHRPQDPRDPLLRGDQARPPGVAQSPYLVEPFRVELFFGLSLWLEPMYGCSDVVDQIPSGWGARFLLQRGLVTLGHQGPLHMDNLICVGSG